MTEIIFISLAIGILIYNFADKLKWEERLLRRRKERKIAWAKRDYNCLYKEHKFQMEKVRQDEYLRKAKERAEKEGVMDPDEQRREISKLAKGLFTNVKEM